MVLSADEVVQFLVVPSLKTRTALTTAYAAGLRAFETVGLKVADIVSESGVIRVEHSKGGKDATSCCRRSFWAFFASIGGWHGAKEIRAMAAAVKLSRRMNS